MALREKADDLEVRHLSFCEGWKPQPERAATVGARGRLQDAFDLQLRVVVGASFASLVNPFRFGH